MKTFNGVLLIQDLRETSRKELIQNRINDFFIRKKVKSSISALSFTERSVINLVYNIISPR